MIDLRKKLIEAGARNLREFGFTIKDDNEILTAPVLWAFFSEMLKDHVAEKRPGYTVAQELLDEHAAKQSEGEEA